MIRFSNTRSGRIYRADGTAVNVADALDLPVQSAYSGVGPATIELTTPATGLAIINEGSAPLTVSIGWVSVVVAPGRAFDDRFEPFSALQIDGSSAWALCVKGPPGPQSRWFDGVTPEIAATFRNGASTGYKGTSFTVKLPANLEAVARRVVSATPAAEQFQVWRVASDLTFDVKLAEGLFGTQRDAGGFVSGALAEPVPLEVGARYIVVFRHISSTNGFYFESSLGIVSRNPVFDYTSDMTYNYNGTEEPAPGIAMGGGAGAYDFRFKLTKAVT